MFLFILVVGFPSEWSE